MAQNGSKLLQMDPNGSKWLEMAQNDSKLLKIALNSSKIYKPLKKCQNVHKNYQLIFFFKELKLHKKNGKKNPFRVSKSGSKWLQMTPESSK